ncbi:UbiA family prenyltransferase [Luteibacter aegosomatis]|uniref:UbiA family prenyltransferase n=1 Tax=Luteibacter aegosomatis TaxID=2911537 RepID=UPI001FF949AA|nr:UbiA family prenyltransferase [Luteibacter aegosomatis]UPG86538.1 UbiA family prenyltransferase [Luteibacter aegosomatis]
MAQESTPLCVDLDGTLIRSDLLVESALALISQHPLMIFSMLIWLMRGKAYLKKQIAIRVSLDASSLPYNEELLAWLRNERTHRPLILCTASDMRLTAPVAQHVAIFDDVLASDGHVNLSGSRKAEALVERFGQHGFDYIGNAPVDIAVWKHARFAYVVERGTTLSSAASKVARVERRFGVPGGGMKAWAKAIRIHQWIKNLLVFLPLIAAHRIFDVGALTNAVLGFLAFGLCASSVYLTNDLLDLPSDRKHHRKRNRPFAAGTLPVVAGPVLAFALLFAGFALAFVVSTQFTAILLCYYILTTAYSFKLKRIMMLDVVVLAMLYTSRILAGASATQTAPSFWLLAFSMFIFLSLAMVKRYTELLGLQSRGEVTASGRGYDVEDIPLIQSMGSSSGYLAVLVLALYIESTASSMLYRHPHYLWMLCPLLLYWISRTWAIAHRGVMHDDPVVFAVMDNTSRILGVVAAIIIALSI